MPLMRGKCAHAHKSAFENIEFQLATKSSTMRSISSQFPDARTSPKGSIEVDQRSSRRRVGGRKLRDMVGGGLGGNWWFSKTEGGKYDGETESDEETNSWNRL